MLSSPPTSKITTSGTLMHIEPFTHDAYKEAYSEDEEFKVQQLHSQIHVHDGDITIDYHLQDGLLYRLDMLCVPKGEQLQLIGEAHTSMVVGHFGLRKTMANLHRYVYWPKMQEHVARFIIGCMLYLTCNPSNMKQCLYHPLPILTHP